MNVKWSPEAGVFVGPSHASGYEERNGWGWIIIAAARARLCLSSLSCLCYYYIVEPSEILWKNARSPTAGGLLHHYGIIT